MWDSSLVIPQAIEKVDMCFSVFAVWWLLTMRETPRNKSFLSRSCNMYTSMWVRCSYLYVPYGIVVSISEKKNCHIIIVNEALRGWVTGLQPFEYWVQVTHETLVIKQFPANTEVSSSVGMNKKEIKLKCLGRKLCSAPILVLHIQSFAQSAWPVTFQVGIQIDLSATSGEKDFIRITPEKFPSPSAIDFHAICVTTWRLQPIYHQNFQQRDWNRLS